MHGPHRCSCPGHAAARHGRKRPRGGACVAAARRRRGPAARSDRGRSRRLRADRRRGLRGRRAAALVHGGSAHNSPEGRAQGARARRRDQRADRAAARVADRAREEYEPYARACVAACSKRAVRAIRFLRRGDVRLRVGCFQEGALGRARGCVRLAARTADLVGGILDACPVRRLAPPLPRANQRPPGPLIDDDQAGCHALCHPYVRRTADRELHRPPRGCKRRHRRVPAITLHWTRSHTSTGNSLQLS